MEKLLKAIDFDPILSAYPKKTIGLDGCNMRAILNSFHYDIPIMIERIVPWRNEVEAVSSSSKKYFAMMMVSSYGIENSSFLADIVNVIFNCTNWDESLAKKAVNSAKKQK